jgi:uncharacterized membrane protein
MSTSARQASEEAGSRWWRLDPTGLILGTAFAVSAMTPSLLPRGWLFQGVVSGIAAASGYGLGVVAAWLVRRSAAPLRRRARWRRVEAQVRRRWSTRWAWAALLVAIPAVLLAVLAVSAGWQRQTDTLVGLSRTTTSGWFRAGPVLLVVAALLMAFARGVRWLYRVVLRMLGRWIRLPRRVLAAVAALLIAALLVTVVNDVLLRHALSAADGAFDAVNEGTVPGDRQPQSAARSGSPTSLVRWDTLGREGRHFVAGGPSRQQLTEVGTPTGQDPVRVYVGLRSAATAQARANLAVAELERTGAFSRPVLVVVTSTGNGWVNSAAISGLELLYRGNTAAVSTQYSYLPSALSFLLDRTRAEEAGRLLFDAVSARVRRLPAQSRPRLLAYGESLGSLGSEAAFGSLADIRANADGVLWVGPPNANTVWRILVGRRDPGTREVDPVYASGLVVRFAAGPAGWRQPPTPWLRPRVLYLQHPSDPVVWWSWDLLLHRPDWLAERRGSDVSPAMQWYPVVTFWQVTFDLLHAQDVPDGHGHNYGGDAVLDAWIAVAPPEGWTAGDTALAHRALSAPGS